MTCLLAGLRSCAVSRPRHCGDRTCSLEPIVWVDEMATGRSNKLVGQTGEYLVAAELSRRGLIATTFTGNVPHYDIIASDESGRTVSIQVKASRGSSWQFGNITQYCDIEFDGERQVVGGLKTCPVRRLVMVFVSLEANGNDRFYIIPWKDFCCLLAKHHKEFLARNDGRRPKRWESLHCAISEGVLLRYQDKWETVERLLK